MIDYMFTAPTAIHNLLKTTITYFVLAPDNIDSPATKTVANIASSGRGSDWRIHSLYTDTLDGL